MPLVGIVHIAVDGYPASGQIGAATCPADKVVVAVNLQIAIAGWALLVVADPPHKSKGGRIARPDVVQPGWEEVRRSNPVHEYERQIAFGNEGSKGRRHQVLRAHFDGHAQISDLIDNIV